MKFAMKKKRLVCVMLILAIIASFTPTDMAESASKAAGQEIGEPDGYAHADLYDGWDPYYPYDPWYPYDPYDPYNPYDPYDPYEPWETEEPIATEEPVITPVETTAPEPTKAPSTTKPKTKEQKVLKKILKQKKKYPDGTPWDNSVCYHWTALGYNLTGCGCVAFACRLSDAAFGKNKKAKEIRSPAAKKIRIGDIIRLYDDTHSAIVIGRKGKYFTIAEGNINSSVYWGRKISKKEHIDYVWTRW